MLIDTARNSSYSHNTMGLQVPAERPPAITVSEWRLLQYLTRRRGIVVPWSDLSVYLWHSDGLGANEIAKFAARRLQQKVKTAFPIIKMFVVAAGVLLDANRDAEILRSA